MKPRLPSNAQSSAPPSSLAERHRVRRRRLRWLSLLTLSASTLATPSTAHAQSSTSSPTGKGITGGALLGAEAVLLLEVLFQVESHWAYAIGGVGGGVGGGVAGYLVEQDAHRGSKFPIYLLAGGLALLIPTSVAVVKATAYHPGKTYTEDEPPDAEPPSQPGASQSASLNPSKTSARAKARQRGLNPEVAGAPRAPSWALFALEERALSLSVPQLELRELYSHKEIKQYGLRQHTRLLVPLFGYTF